MSNQSEERDAKVEAAENVVERADGWDAGAEPDTVAAHLREGFADAGVQVDDAAVDDIAEAVHREDPASIDPDDVV